MNGFGKLNRLDPRDEPEDDKPGLVRVYSAHASSLAAALRWGALRATAGRPCLGTSCGGLFRSR